MEEVIYQLKTILEDLHFVQSSLRHIAQLMETSEMAKSFAAEHHLDSSLTQASHFAIGAALRLEMAQKAFEKAKASEGLS